MTCDEWQMLAQADVDGELPPAEAARVAAHLDGCSACASLHAQLRTLSERLHAEVPRPAMPAFLAQWAAAQGPPRPRDPQFRFALPFGTGFAVAAALGLLLVLPGRLAIPDGGVVEAALDDHLRALQPGHLMDVASTDQHTVKPWFDGRIGFAPPVQDLQQAGFPLVGGRLDYLDGRLAAVMVYQRRKHVIDLFALPQDGSDTSPATVMRAGYTLIRWRQGGMALCAVSDVEGRELERFVRLWRQAA